MGGGGSSLKEIPQNFTETQYPQQNNYNLIYTENFKNYNNNIIIIKLFLIFIFLLILFIFIKKSI